MKPKFHLFSAIMLLVYTLAGTYTTRGADVPPHEMPVDGLLVLSNGSVIDGLITCEGEYYSVVLPKGKLQVRADQVDFMCRSKEEAYVRRQARRINQTSSIEAHLEMARWCVRQDLFAYAKAEIDEARRLEPQHRQIPIVLRSLSQRQVLVQRAQAKVTIAEQDSTASANLSQPRHVTSEVPAWARTEFIKRVQPMLVNSCATAGCHVPNSSQHLQIDRTALDGVGNPELFQRNLAAVMEMVNTAEPEASPLLAMGGAVHGTGVGLQSRPLTQHQLEILRAWITQLGLEESPREEEEPRVASTEFGRNGPVRQKHIPPAQSPEATPDPFDPAAFNAEVATPTDAAKAIQTEVPAQTAQE